MDIVFTDAMMVLSRDGLGFGAAGWLGMVGTSARVSEQREGRLGRDWPGAEPWKAGLGGCSVRFRFRFRFRWCGRLVVYHRTCCMLQHPRRRQMRAPCGHARPCHAARIAEGTTPRCETDGVLWLVGFCMRCEPRPRRHGTSASPSAWHFECASSRQSSSRQASLNPAVAAPATLTPHPALGKECSRSSSPT
jgi:hypothetical protein